MIKTCPCRKNREFLLFYQPKKEAYARYGISSPKKLGNAVTRNKLRRRVRAILGEYQKCCSNKYDCIIIIRKSCLDRSFQELRDSLTQLLEKGK